MRDRPVLGLGVAFFVFLIFYLFPSPTFASGRIINICGLPVNQGGVSGSSSGCGDMCSASSSVSGGCLGSYATSKQVHICGKGYYSDSEWPNAERCDCTGGANCAWNPIGLDSWSIDAIGNQPYDYCMVQIDSSNPFTGEGDFMVWKDPAKCGNTPATCTVTMSSPVKVGDKINYSVGINGASINSATVSGPCSGRTGCPNGFQNGTCTGQINATAVGTCTLTVTPSSGSCPQRTSTINANCTTIANAINTQVGYGATAADQNLINGGASNGSNCPTANLIFTTNVPNYSGTQRINAVCVKGTNSIANLTKLIVQDIDKAITIQSSGTQNAPYLYKATSLRGTTSESFRTDFPGGNSNGTNYCAKNGATANICFSNMPIKASSPSHITVADILNGSKPTSPDFLKKSKTAISDFGTPDQLTWNHNATGAELLIVGLSYRDSNGPNTTNSRVNNVKFNGVNLKPIPNSFAAIAQKRYAEMWYLVNPSSGTFPIVVNFKTGNGYGSGDEAIGGAVTYANTYGFLKPGNEFSATVSAINNPAISSTQHYSKITLNNLPLKNVMFAVATAQTDADGSSPTIAPITTNDRNRWNFTAPNNKLNGQGAQTIVVGPSTTLQWYYTFSPAQWVTSAVGIKGVDTGNTLTWTVDDWGLVCGGTTSNYSRLSIWKRNADGSNGTSILNRNVLPNGKTSYQFNVAPNISLPAFGDYNWQIDVSNDNANWVAGDIWSFRVAEPDLSLPISGGRCSSVNVSPSTCLTGQTISITPTIFNLGNAAFPIAPQTTATINFAQQSGPATINISPSTYTGTIPASPGTQASSTVTVGCPTTAGTYNYAATIAPVTGESVTSNNSCIFSFTASQQLYFQTIGGGATSLGGITSKLPSGIALSKKTVTGANPGDAGIISTRTSATLGSGIYSENGVASPGWNRSGITSMPHLDKITYNELYLNVLRNAGVDESLTNITSLCNTTSALALGYFDSGSYRIFCYKNIGDINTALANAPVNKTSLIIPNPSAPAINLANPAPANISIGATKKVVLFITPDPANLASTTTFFAPATTVVDPSNTTGLVTIVNGGINAAKEVAVTGTQLDGVYIFSGQFDSGANTTPLNGKGSLIGTGTASPTPFNFHRQVNSGSSSESWTYQPKYLWLFRNILTLPSYSWKELTPQ